MSVHQQLLVAAFPTYQQAEQAIADLRGRGFSDGQMSYAGAYAHDKFFRGLARAIANGPDAIDVSGHLVDLGLPTEMADFYAHEHAAGRSILAIEAGKRADEAVEIMRQHGAFDYSGIPGSQTSEITPSPMPSPRHRAGEAVRPDVDV